MATGLIPRPILAAQGVLDGLNQVLQGVLQGAPVKPAAGVPKLGQSTGWVETNPK